MPEVANRQRFLHFAIQSLSFCMPSTNPEYFIFSLKLIPVRSDNESEKRDSSGKEGKEKKANAHLQSPPQSELNPTE